MHRLTAAAFALAFAAVAACGSSDGAAPRGSSSGSTTDGGVSTTDGAASTGAPSNLPCDVDAILKQDCQVCHSSPPQYGAPMPLMSWDDLQAAPPSGRFAHVYEAVAARVADATSPMPPAPSPRLSAADQKTLTDYAAAGAPKTTCGAAGGGDGGASDPTLDLTCTPDRTLAPASPYAMPAVAGDQYVCWAADITATTPTHIVGFAPKIDNKTIVHHLVMYEAPDDGAITSTPTPCDAGISLTWRLVYAWAPGVKALETPPQAGFPVSSSSTSPTHYVVQMHYSNPQGLANQTDATSFAICTAPPRQYEADVLAFGTQNIDIPAQPPPGGTYTRDCTVNVTGQFSGLHFFAGAPHMHKLGAAMSTTVERGGAKLDLGSQPSFDFNTQAWFPLDVTSEDGDVIRTKCSWKNTTGKEVRFGETTADEMCYSFTMYYPRISSSLWSWATPALISSCTTE